MLGGDAVAQVFGQTLTQCYTLSKKSAKGDPTGQPRRAAYIMMREAPPCEEAPVARAGPRSPDAFYRGEEAGAVPKTYRSNKMRHLENENVKTF